MEYADNNAAQSCALLLIVQNIPALSFFLVHIFCFVQGRAYNRLKA